MQICILHIGTKDVKHKSFHKPSPERFINLLEPFLDDSSWVTINCLKDDLPIQVENFDAYLITGGKYSVFENIEWQNNLFNFIHKIYNANIPLIGICYGHQAIAHTLGGNVERYSNGWGIGLTTINVVEKAEWMEPITEKVNLLSMHQDQVTEIPPSATRFLGNNFCYNSGFYIDNKVLAIQQHPEFTPELCRDLIIKRKDRIGGNYIEALDSLNIKHQGKIIGSWMARFITLHKKN
jgi:GMP synthase (glutamine-hydrolysing)